ncbi:PorV/PorQ family protein [Candidatus Latescibacterota bacterium]
MKFIRIPIALFVMTVLFCDTAYCVGEVGETGATGLSFLKISPTAQITSLGSGSTAYSTGSTAAWSNPALLVQNDERSTQVSHIEWIEGIRQEFAAFSTGSSIGHFGFGVNIFDSGDIDGRGLYGEDTGTYGIINAALSVSYAAQLKKGIALGATFKKIFQKMSSETANGYAIDFGITANTPLEGFSVACAARNYGSMSKLKNESTKLPSDVVFGCAYTGMLPGIDRTYYLVGDYVIPKYGDSGARLGLELEPVNRFKFRIGYRSDSDIEDMSYGIGFNHEMFYFDAAYTPMKEGFDNAIRFTLGLSGF